MLEKFIFAHKSAIISRTRAALVSEASAGPTELPVQNDIPLFLDQLGEALRARGASDSAHEQINVSADLHGHELRRVGRPIAQVVRDYGEVCQSIAELCVEQGAPISGEEFKTLVLCLENAIAGAVTGYARRREREIMDQGFERLGILAHELRNLVNTALLSYDALKSKRAIPKSTDLVLRRSLFGLRDLVNRSLTEVRIHAGFARVERVSVAELVKEVMASALVHAETIGIRLSADIVDARVSVEGDRQILFSAVSNLLQNALKFSREHGKVLLTVQTTNDRVLIDVADECGGLSGEPEELFRPFVQRGTNKSGVGLGLSVCSKAAEASSGKLHVRNVPGTGCIFTLDLPRKDTFA